MTTSFDPEAVKEELLDLDDSLADLRDSLSPLQLDSHASLSSFLQDQEDPISRAKMLVTLAYTIDSLLFCHLKLTGTSTEGHSIMSELQRIKQYVNKIKDCSIRRKVDGSVARRMIGHDLSLNRHAKDGPAQEQKKEEKERNVVGKHTRFKNGIAQETHKVTDNDGDEDGSEKGQSLRNDKGKEQKGMTEASLVQCGQGKEQERRTKRTKRDEEGQQESMFQESKVERKNRERRERKAAKRLRQKKDKEKKTTQEGDAASLIEE